MPKTRPTTARHRAGAAGDAVRRGRPVDDGIRSGDVITTPRSYAMKIIARTEPRGKPFVACATPYGPTTRSGLTSASPG